ncbi:MAG: bifunctional glutamate N-acetyltransferase/amino-acid acetyltransferase ArgJ [Lachnospiraceae bacterium]|nr:bifunctional glutamate N-acetyltransferase/amino-acid acetyltransferase ArgJ [Lachnospiraceae bacterium]
MGFREIEGGVTAARGFKAAGAEAQLKYKGRLDMAMIYSEKPCTVAGTFTKNIVKAAPVKWDMRIVEKGECVHAAVVNSGIANACTGKEGMSVCEETASHAAKLLGIDKDQVLIGSTGVIGMQLSIEKLKNGINALVPKLTDSVKAGNEAERAIMTTDTVPKEIAVELKIGDKTVRIGGMSKGSGMIHPNMCTMLAYITTDAVISREILTEIVKQDIEDTFNMISVDGDTSTNDTYLVFANGAAGNKEINKEDGSYEAFRQALHFVNESLAKRMAKDGEGATALFEAKIINAASKAEAKILAKSMIGSMLSKAAIFGHDANFGRFLCALGYSGVTFDPENIDLYFESRAGRLLIYSDGVQAEYSEQEATEILSEDEVTVIADMKQGQAEAVAWGCDLTYDYVKINADYRS